MRIVVCPDKFKGSLSAAAAARAIAAGLRRRFPRAEITELPLADGGEGSLDVLAARGGYTLRRRTVTGPLRRPVSATYLAAGSRAVIAAEAACGLRHVPPPRRDPGYTTTIGVGELIEDAVVRGARVVTLLLGGSATNDGGAGMAGALGYRFFSDRPGDFIPTGDSLRYVQRIDRSAVLPNLASVTFTAACDVRNPLTGPAGAAYVYAPQKGATPEQLPVLDAGLAQLARCWWSDLGVDAGAVAGSGAAGGLGGGCLAFLGAGLRPGAELILDAVDFDRAVAGADLVVTGEGKLDAQTLSGKVVAAVCRRTAAPVVALCGSSELTTDQARQLGMAGVGTLRPAADETTAHLHAARLLSELVSRLPLPL